MKPRSKPSRGESRPSLFASDPFFNRQGIGTTMSPTSIPRGDGLARAIGREQQTFQDSRIWDCARRNLTLLYGGRCKVCIHGELHSDGAGCCSGHVHLEP
jgi:hypothetical protein